MLTPDALIAPLSVGTLNAWTSAVRDAAWPRLSNVRSPADFTLPVALTVQSVHGVRPSSVPCWTVFVVGSYSRKIRLPVATSPSVAIVRTYSAEPGTCLTDDPSIAVIALSFEPRWPSPKLVNDTPNVDTTGTTWNATRKIVPGMMYLSGMCHGCR